MLSEPLINPRSIVVVGGSENIQKPGGKVLKILKEGTFSGKLYVLNPKEDKVQGLKSYRKPDDLPDTDLAILAVAARHCTEMVDYLARNKETRGFIILSAGFGEESEEGREMEHRIAEIVTETGGSLIGPNCIGVINRNYQAVFTTPVPKLDPKGCDFISGSGATAVFIMEAGIPNGLTFSSVYSVGNSAQIGVEEVLQHMDETYDPQTSSQVKLLYVEHIEKPQLLLKHASSLIRKGCKIAAIKSGTSEAGSRAASSHTGALASPDTAVEALFRKAGIVRCDSREELVAVASVFMHKKLTGENIAIITHAGGPAVMLTDILSNGGLNVPKIRHPAAAELRDKLFPGSSVANPIDFLATANAEQLGYIIDYCEQYFDEIDAMVVIFGSPGLVDVYDVYHVLDEKMQTCKKPIYPVLPSVINAKDEIGAFIAKGRINFPDEVVLGRALSKVYCAPVSSLSEIKLPEVNKKAIRQVITSSRNGWLSPEKVNRLLDAAGIKRPAETIVKDPKEAVREAEKVGYPVVLKVVGPLHKSDIGGVALNISTQHEVSAEYDRLMQIKGAAAVQIQSMHKGAELFAGIKYEPDFGHLILCGLGGIYVEIFKDTQSALAPLTLTEATDMIERLKGKNILKGARGIEPVEISRYADVLVKLSALACAAPEIREMDLNPLIGQKDEVVAVDARINIEKIL